MKWQKLSGLPVFHFASWFHCSYSTEPLERYLNLCQCSLWTCNNGVSQAVAWNTFLTSDGLRLYADGSVYLLVRPALGHPTVLNNCWNIRAVNERSCLTAARNCSNTMKTNLNVSNINDCQLVAVVLSRWLPRGLISATRFYCLNPQHILVLYNYSWQFNKTADNQLLTAGLTKCHVDIFWYYKCFGLKLSYGVNEHFEMVYHNRKETHLFISDYFKSFKDLTLFILNWYTFFSLKIYWRLHESSAFWLYIYLS